MARAVLAALLLLVASLGVAACGDDDDDGGERRATTTEQTAAITNERRQRGDDDHGRLEELHRAEGARRDLRPGARGRRLHVKKELNLGDEKIALKALKGGEIDAYPEYTGTALGSFFDVKSDDIPKDPAGGVRATPRRASPRRT